MARVVHRRKSPPYALIIFVFLFLVAAALAIIVYNKLEDKKTELADTEKVIVRLAGRADGQGRHEALRAGLAAELYKKKDERPVLAELADREKALREIISNQAATKDDAWQEVTTLRKDINDHGPLVDVVRKLQTQLADRKKRITDLQGKLDQAEQNRKSFEDKNNQLTNDLKTVTAAKDAEIKNRDEALNAYQEEQSKKLREAQQKWDDDRTEKDKEVAKLSGQVAQLTKERNDLKLKNEILEKKTKPRPEPPDIVHLAFQPDGKILRVLDGEGACYVSIGSKDRVVPGLTFAVYPAGKGPHTDTLPKGNITVMKTVGASLSECRIDKVVDPEHPVVAGDAIANVAFSAVRTYTFVVEGQFDLYGQRHPTALGTKQVKALIQKFRGEVAEELSPQTDFVVMGVAPAQPAKPKDEAPDSEKVVYDEQMKVVNKYKDVRDNAVKMRIPVLNASRFLALVGYSPTQTLK